MTYIISDLALEHAACPTCQAHQLQPCVTRTGRRAHSIHARRTAAVIAGWRLGYGEGIRDVIDTVEREGRDPALTERLRAVYAYLDKTTTT